MKFELSHSSFINLLEKANQDETAKKLVDTVFTDLQKNHGDNNIPPIILTCFTLDEDRWLGTWAVMDMVYPEYDSFDEIRKRYIKLRVPNILQKLYGNGQLIRRTRVGDIRNTGVTRQYYEYKLNPDKNPEPNNLLDSLAITKVRNFIKENHFFTMYDIHQLLYENDPMTKETKKVVYARLSNLMRTDEVKSFWLKNTSFNKLNKLMYYVDVNLTEEELIKKYEEMMENGKLTKHN